MPRVWPLSMNWSARQVEPADPIRAPGLQAVSATVPYVTNGVFKKRFCARVMAGVIEIANEKRFIAFVTLLDGNLR